MLTMLAMGMPLILGAVGWWSWDWLRRWLGRLGWWSMAQRALTAGARDPLPPDAVAISTAGAAPTVRSDLLGAFLLVSIGTFGLNQLARLLGLLERCGLQQLVGSILVIENDAQLRLRFHERIPPIFHDRIVYGYSEAYAGGMVNKPIAWVLQHIDVWGPPLQRAVAEVIDIQLRRNGSQAPANIFLFQSQGGHSPLGLPVLELLHERFEETLMVGFTALPRFARLRERFKDLKHAYEQRGIFGWVLTDNLGPDPVTADYGMVALIAALADAALHADQATQPNNTFSHAFTLQPGAILIYQVVSTSMVGYPLAGAGSYYVLKQPVVEQALKSLRRLEQDRGTFSAALTVGEAGTSTFDILMLSLLPADLRLVADEVGAGRKLRERFAPDAAVPGALGQGNLFGQANYETIIASLATTIQPDKPLCPVIAVRLTAVHDGANQLDAIITAPQERTPPLLTVDNPPPAPPVTLTIAASLPTEPSAAQEAQP